MTLTVPATIPGAPRNHLMRRMPDESGVVAMTVVVAPRPGEPRHSFHFRPARRTADPPLADASETKRHAPTIQGEAPSASDECAPWLQPVYGSSSEFLAGVIAQTWSGARLHNPQHRAATRLYRNADLLGLPAGAPALRETRI